MDNLAIQRSLTVLEDRYRELLEMGETRFQALEAEKAAASKSAEELKQQLAAQTEAVQQAQKARDELMARVKDLEGETAQLRERLTALQGELEASQQAREEQAERQKDMEAETSQLQQQLKEAAAAPALPAPELQALERQLQEAREDADLLLVQLHQVQEELEHYYLLWLNQDRADPQAAPLAQAPAPPKQDPQADTRVINSFRQRLLATT